MLLDYSVRRGTGVFNMSKLHLEVDLKVVCLGETTPSGRWNPERSSFDLDRGNSQKSRKKNMTTGEKNELRSTGPVSTTIISTRTHARTPPHTHTHPFAPTPTHTQTLTHTLQLPLGS